MTRRLWSFFAIFALFAVGSPAVVVVAPALAASPMPAKNPPTAAPAKQPPVNDKIPSPTMVLAAPKIVSLGNVDCSTIPTPSDQCFNAQAAGKLGVVVSWQSCADPNTCLPSIQNIAVYSAAHPGPQGPLANAPYLSGVGAGTAFFLDKFESGECFVARASLVTDNGQRQRGANFTLYSPPSSPVCVNSSTRFGKETVNVPATIAGYYTAHMGTCWSLPTEGNVNLLTTQSALTVGSMAFNSCGGEVSVGAVNGVIEYSVTAAFDQVDPWRMLKATMVVTKGAICAGQIGPAGKWTTAGPGFAGPIHKLHSQDTFALDVTAWMKQFGTTYVIAAPNSYPYQPCTTPPSIGPVHLVLERLKPPN